MAYGERTLTTKEIEYYTSLFKYILEEFKCGRRSEFDLSGKGINPTQCIKVLASMGYPVESVIDDVEEYDCFWFFENINILLFSNGLTYELKLYNGINFKG